MPQVEFLARPGEELGVTRQCPRPPTLDEANPELVEQPGHSQLVRNRVAEPLALGAVALGTGTGKPYTGAAPVGSGVPAGPGAPYAVKRGA